MCYTCSCDIVYIFNHRLDFTEIYGCCVPTHNQGHISLQERYLYSKLMYADARQSALTHRQVTRKTSSDPIGRRSRDAPFVLGDFRKSTSAIQPNYILYYSHV